MQPLPGRTETTLGDQIWVDEILAVRVIGQEFSREGRLARTIRACDDINVWAHRHFSRM